MFDVDAVIEEIPEWSNEDRERLWSVLRDLNPPLTEGQCREIDHRVALMDAHPELLVPWEEVKAYVRRSR